MTDILPKRRFLRYPYQVPVLARLVNRQAERYCRLEQLGRGGCSFSASGPLPIDKEVALEICLGGGVLRAFGRIAYQHRDPDGYWQIGVEFRELDPLDLPLLDLAILEAASGVST